MYKSNLYHRDSCVPEPLSNFRLHPLAKEVWGDGTRTTSFIHHRKIWEPVKVSKVSTASQAGSKLQKINGSSWLELSHHQLSPLSRWRYRWSCMEPVWMCLNVCCLSASWRLSYRQVFVLQTGAYGECGCCLALANVLLKGSLSVSECDSRNASLFFFRGT